MQEAVMNDFHLSFGFSPWTVACFQLIFHCHNYHPFYLLLALNRITPSKMPSFTISLIQWQTLLRLPLPFISATIIFHFLFRRAKRRRSRWWGGGGRGGWWWRRWWWCGCWRSQITFQDIHTASHFKWTINTLWIHALSMLQIVRRLIGLMCPGLIT